MLTMEEKIPKMDANVIRNMIRSKVIPEIVLVEYFRVKVLLDRVSAGMVPGMLALIVLKSGIPIEGLPKVRSKSADLSAEEFEEIIGDETGTDESQPDLPSPKPEIQNTEAPAEPEGPDWPERAYKKHTTVTTFWEGQIVEGEVFNAYHADEGSDVITYQVSIEGTDDPVTVLEEEVNVVEDK